MCLHGTKFILTMSIPIGQEAAFGVCQNCDRFKVKFARLGDWCDVRIVNIATF